MGILSANATDMGSRKHSNQAYFPAQTPHTENFIDSSASVHKLARSPPMNSCTPVVQVG
jgi:hypothetical protein